MNDNEVLELVKQYNLQHRRPEELQSWFELIKYFKPRFEPPANVILWYRAGLKNELANVLEKMPNYSQKDSEQAKIDQLSFLMGVLNKLDQ